MPRTCSDADRPFVHVTPRTVSDVTRAVTCISGGAAISAWCRLFLSTTIISLVLPLFSVRLFARAHVSAFLSSMDLESALLAGMSKYIGYTDLYLGVGIEASARWWRCSHYQFGAFKMAVHKLEIGLLVCSLQPKSQRHSDCSNYVFRIQRDYSVYIRALLH